MDIKNILAHCDHTLLSPTATFAQIKEVLDDAIKYKTASACIPPCYVRQAKEYVGGMLKICTVIGFPNGYNATEVKLFETLEAIDSGADDVDMVINLSRLKAGDYDYVASEIRKIKALCVKRSRDLNREIILKVIVETCFLTDAEKRKMCKIVTECKADYIKTSTGFGTGGATKEDVKLFKECIGEGVKIKAAGGISSLEDAQEFLDLGCSRLGTSRVVKCVKAAEKK